MIIMNDNVTYGDDNSILDTVKHLLGPSGSYDVFDLDITTHINAAFLDLQQLGVGPEEGFMITGNKETWLDFMPSGTALNAVRSYVYLKVKLIFDSPTSSTVLESYKQMLERLEWRINLAVESSKTNGKENSK